MLSGRTVSVKELIGEIYASHKYTYELPWNDAIEWSINAIELIGAPQSLTPKIGRIIIDNYRGMLPCDLHDITQAAGSIFGCSPFPMRYNTNSFHAVHTCDTQLLTVLIDEFNQIPNITQPIGEDISGNPVYTFQNGNMSLPETINDTSNSFGLTDPTYSVNGNFAFTNFESGFMFFAYNALPVDSEGFPTIPDNRRFKEAVKAYIVSKIDYILWRNSELPKEMFEHSEREWMWYVASAGNATRIPNADGMFSLQKAMKLIPQKYSHNQFFKNLGA